MVRLKIILVLVLLLTYPCHSGEVLSGGAVRGLTIGSSNAPIYNKTLVAPFYFYGTTPLWTKAAVTNYVLGTSAATINGYLLESSWGRFGLYGDTLDWMELPNGIVPGDNFNDIKTAADSVMGAVDPSYRYVIYAFSSVESMQEAYGGSLAFPPMWTFAHDIEGVMYGGDPDKSLADFIHPWQHFFYGVKSSDESHGLKFATNYLSKIILGLGAPGSRTPEYLQYGDAYDTSGHNEFLYALNLPKREMYGWTGTSYITSVTTGGSFTILPLASSAAGRKGLRILRQDDITNGVVQYYYVEYRTATGVSHHIPVNSVLLHVTYYIWPVGWEQNRVGVNTFLLDMTPESLTNTSIADMQDAPALPVGSTFYDADRQISIYVASQDANGASVEVSFGTPSANLRVAPTIVASAEHAGPPKHWHVSVTNNDHSYFGSSDFMMSASVSTMAVIGLGNWTWDYSTIAVAPGATGDAILSAGTDNAYPLTVYFRTYNKGNPLFWNLTNASYSGP